MNFVKPFFISYSFIIFRRLCPIALSNSCHIFSSLEGNFILSLGVLRRSTEDESHSGFRLSSGLVLPVFWPEIASWFFAFRLHFLHFFLLQWIFKPLSVLNGLPQSHLHSGMPLTKTDSKSKVRVMTIRPGDMSHLYQCSNNNTSICSALPPHGT